MSIHDTEHDDLDKAIQKMLNVDVNAALEERLKGVCAAFRDRIGQPAQTGIYETQQQPIRLEVGTKESFIMSIIRSSSARKFRWAVSAVAVVTIVALVVGLNQGAKAQTLAALRAATSFICNIESAKGSEDKASIHHTLTWLAPDKIRLDLRLTDPPMDETHWIEGSHVTILNRQSSSAQVIDNMPDKSKPTMESSFGNL